MGSFYSDWPYRTPADILPFIHATAQQGDANAVLAAIDTFAAAYPMFRSGPEKGQLLERLVSECRPALALEVGTFMGYGAIRIARQLPQGGKLVSLEGDAAQADVARQIIAWAGLEGRVQVMTGLARSSLPMVAQQQQPGEAAGFVFLDHCKPCYTPDLIRMEELGLIQRGTVVAADNVIVPGAPGYLKHVGAGPVDGAGGESSDDGVSNRKFRYRTELIEAEYEVEERYKPNWKPQKDAVAVSYCL